MKNILEDRNKRSRNIKKETNSTLKYEVDLNVESKVVLDIPFLNRLSLLFSSKLSTAYIRQIGKNAAITSTEIS